VLKVGDEIEARIVSTDRKNRLISLSIKAKDIAEEKTAVQEHKKLESETIVPTTIGDLIKAQMGGGDK
jgi:small subunit ribosomal protein S1